MFRKLPCPEYAGDCSAEAPAWSANVQRERACGVWRDMPGNSGELLQEAAIVADQKQAAWAVDQGGLQGLN